MKTLVLIDNHGGKATKASLEAISYAISMNAGNVTEVTGIVFGKIEGDANTSVCGLTQLVNVPSLGDTASMAQFIVKYLNESGSALFISSHDNTGKEIAPRVAVAWEAAMISGVTQMASANGTFSVKKNVFSGKAISEVVTNDNKVVMTVLPNSFGVKKQESAVAIETKEGVLTDGKVKLAEVKGNHAEGGIPLPEADIVVSGGRGMKGPEHWSPIEELAKELGAATACSRPVSDIGWRPHHEHVGQTGIAVRPNLYIAVGISGAIQHLAGVNGSKVIVVINKDPEAPFFKAADYGIVGDAFEVLPKIIDAAKAYNASK
jgi:electron transfer flavoprotein alpha subunit